jgi:ATP-binding cassette subfamily B protein
MASSANGFVHVLRDTAQQASCWPRAWRLIWAAAPRLTLLWAALLCARGMVPLFGLVLTRGLVDSIAGGAGGGSRQWGLTPLLVALVGGVLLAVTLQQAAEGVRVALAEFVNDHIRRQVHRQAAAADLGLYDSPAYHDLLEQARTEAAGGPLALLQSAGSLVQSALALAGMAVVLTQYGVWLPAALVAGTLPGLYAVVRRDRGYHQWWQRTTPARRRAQYYDQILTDKSHAAEIRLFGLAPHFQRGHDALRHRLRTERLHQAWQQSLAGLGAAAGGLVVSGATLTWMLWQVLHGRFTLGDLALLYQAFQRGQGVVRSLVESLGHVFGSTLYVTTLFRFLDMKPTLVDSLHTNCRAPGPVRVTHGIAFSHVTFRYPGSDRAALEDLSLHVPTDTVAAIVGPNGAGKSTLVKLLCRFYDPQAGRLEIDGVDVRAMALADLRRMMTVQFQFPIPFYASVRDNIALGDCGADCDDETVERAARRAGAHDFITGLPRGYGTHLGKWLEDGVDLSGGEWQRLATARVFLRQAPIMVLDEPTSMMDSWDEAEWFGRLRQLARGRIALIITHRFTIARRATVIHVMNRGRLVETGSHDELLAKGGLYARSWNAQTQERGSLIECLPQTV